MHFGGQSTWIYGLSLLPLAEVFAIEFTIPICTVALLAVIFLGERMTKGRFIAISGGFLGILVILQPGIEIIQLGAFVVLGGAMCFGAAITNQKLVSTDSPLAVLFFMCLIQLPMGLIPALFVWVTPQGIEWLYFVIIGLMGLSAHYCEAHAFRHADATVVIPLQFLLTPHLRSSDSCFTIGLWELAVFLGAIIIFSGNYYNIRLEKTGDKRPIEAGLALTRLGSNQYFDEWPIPDFSQKWRNCASSLSTTKRSFAIYCRKSARHWNCTCPSSGKRQSSLATS